MHQPPDLNAESLRQKWRHSVPNLFVLLRQAAKKVVTVWKRLDARSLTHGQCSVLKGMKKTAPVRVTLGQDGRAHLIGVEPPIAFGVVTTARPLQPSGQHVKGNVPPTAALGNVLEPLQVRLSQFRASMVGQYGRTFPQHLLIRRLRCNGVVAHFERLPRGQGRKVRNSVPNCGHGLQVRVEQRQDSLAQLTRTCEIRHRFGIVGR